MKITHVVPYIYPAMVYGGPAKLVYQLAIEQQKQGYDVSILTSDSFNNKRRFSYKEIIEVNQTVQTFFSKNIINSVAYNQRLFTNFGIIKNFIFKLRKTDLFHIHDVYVLPQIFLMYLLILFKKKIIISPHGVLDPVRTRDKGLIKELFFILLKPCLKHSQFIIATSNKERDDLSKLFPKYLNKIKTVWNGVVEANTDIEKSKSNKIRLLYIGKLHPKKGLTKFIKALNKFPNHESTFELTIAGPDDGGKESIDKLINELSIKVNRIDFVDENQKVKLYKDHDIFIHPSDSEGFSISIIEALSYGIPIFVTKACNFEKEDLINTGFLIEDNSLINIQRGLQDVLKTKSKLNQFEINAKELFTKKYTMSNMVKNIDQIIHNSFFGININFGSTSNVFTKAFNLYFPIQFDSLYPKLNSNQKVIINFKNSDEIKLSKETNKFSNFIGFNKDNLEIKHDYLTTQTKIEYIFNQDNINSIKIIFKSSFAFEIINSFLNNLLKNNLFKQITKKYIQQPLLLNISNNNNLNCLHASAVEKNGEVIALVGMNSVGKSTLLTKYLSKGYKLFSDNYLLVSSSGKAYRYPSQIRLDKKIVNNQNSKDFGYGKSLVSGDLSDLEVAKITEIHILQRGKQSRLEKIGAIEAIQLINNLQIIDEEDVRYAVTQLKTNLFNSLKFNKSVIFYIDTIKNNE